MNENQKAKIRMFLNDEVLVDAVKEVFTKSFMKPAGTDVNYLAASRIALDFLNDAFKELETFAVEEVKEERELTNPGL